MFPMIRSTLAALCLPAALCAQEAIVTPYDGSFDDATFAIESAIVDAGLVIDYVSHVGDMLARTRSDVGGSDLFDAAQTFLFCSAVVSRRVMEADPMNIVHCPYGIFVASGPGGVVIGHRDYPDGPMDAVEDLLKRLVAEAAAF